MGWQPWKAQLICLSAGRDGCRMTSAYHSAADHFLTLEGRAACRCTGAAQPRTVPAVGLRTVASWAGAEPRTRPAGFTKGQTQAETLRGPGKGRSFPALPKCHTSAAPPVRCLVQRSRLAQAPTSADPFAFLSSGCLLWLLHVSDEAIQLNATPSGKLMLC